MAKNDVVLLDSLVDKARARLGEHLDSSEIFELFCLEQLLKDYDLSYGEMESGWTDGTNDGGIDGFFVFVDGKLAVEEQFDDVVDYASRQAPEVEVIIFTIRRADSFKQEPLNALSASISELFDLRKPESELAYPFSESVLRQRETFLDTFVALADRRPKLSIKTYYCSRGDKVTLANNLIQRAEQLGETIKTLFSQVSISVDFIGASELLDLARRQPSYSLRLKFIESYISREGKNYVVLAKLTDYFAFIKDEADQLRRYLFESNVRDYLGKGLINQDIRETLKRKPSAVVEDFWWLNNGVTILATHATVVGKEISLENVQIVNGLQTTETIYRYFLNARNTSDDRSILLKIILTSDEATRERIIKATNYQNTVDLASLRGLDKIQQNIELFLLDHGWFYDRRKNFYKNQGKSADRIVSIPYLAAAARAIALGDPASSQRHRSKSLRDEQDYAQVFNPNWDLKVYLASLEITRSVQRVLEDQTETYDRAPIALVHYVGFIYVCSRLGKSGYEAAEVAQLVGQTPSNEQVFEIRDELRKVGGKLRPTLRRFGGIALDRLLVHRMVDDLYGAGKRIRGKVSNIVSNGGFGFIAADDDNNYFFHRTRLSGEFEFGPALVGCEVEFEIKRPASEMQNGEAKRITKAFSSAAQS